jgi:Major royal jelly protein
MSENEVPEIISPFRIRADACGRLWVLDTGVTDLLGNATVLSPTRLLIYDLHDDNLLRSYKFPESHIKEESFFASLAVEDNDCDNSFAYSADLGKPGLVVYSWKTDNSWRITHNFFHPDPTAGNFSINGVNFTWEDGLFGLALSKPQGVDNDTTLYFHPFVSKDEFSVSTKFLKNESFTSTNDNYYEYKRLGTRGDNAQSNAEFLDKNTGVLFYLLPNLNAVACWKVQKDYNVKSQGRIFMNSELMDFPNDVKVDENGRLWVISDRLQKFMYEELDTSEVNFRIFSALVKDAIDHTACDVKTKPLNKIIDNLSGIINKKVTQATVKNGSAQFTATVTLMFIAILTRIL